MLTIVLSLAAVAQNPVRATQPCASPTSSDEIVVCGRRGGNERYRLPQAFRSDGARSGESWAARSRREQGRQAVSGQAIGPFGYLLKRQEWALDWRELRDEKRKEEDFQR